MGLLSITKEIYKVFKYQNKRGNYVDFIMAFQKNYRVTTLRAVAQTDSSVVHQEKCNILMALLAF